MRFVRLSELIASVLLAAVLALAAGPADSQLRTLPAKAKRAQLVGYDNPFVLLDRERLRLAPGALIDDTPPRTILPVAMPQQADVVFTTDSTGAVMRIYLLTPQESQTLDRQRR